MPLLSEHAKTAIQTQLYLLEGASDSQLFELCETSMEVQTVCRDDSFWAHRGAQRYGNTFLNLKEQLHFDSYLSTYEHLVGKKVLFHDDSLIRQLMSEAADDIVNAICEHGDIRTTHICNDPEFWKKREERQKKGLPFFSF